MPHAVAHSIFPAIIPHSRSFEGRFGRLFGRGFSVWTPPGLDAASRLKAIEDYALKTMFGATPPPESSTIPAGFTYFGQFVDHDITFDPQSSLTRKNDPEGLQNFRTPRFDLDSLYGRGPDDQPFLYDQTRRHNGFNGFFLVSQGAQPPERDLQRNEQGVALVGDPRNDENVIVSQLQLAFMLLHNNILEKLTAKMADVEGRKQFEEAQRITRWFYQYVVWNDFLRTLLDPAIFDKAVAIAADGTVTYGLKSVYDWEVNPFLPVEFSVAAYRFGHSMIRTGYQLNFARQNGIGAQFEMPIFDFTNPPGSIPPALVNDLRGGHKLKEKHSLQWDWFFALPSSSGPFPQMANKIDRRIANSVLRIPSGPVETNPLAVLNIRRGVAMELPPASEIVAALGLPLITPDDPMEESLWVYILKEAEDGGGERLGALGSTIVAAVFSGLLRGDPSSYLSKDPRWTPESEGLFRKVTSTPHWGIADLLRAARVPEDVAGMQVWLAGGLPGSP